jgi:hypothetical protein
MKIGQGLGPWTTNAGFIVSAVEALDPLFHLFNGDLCYANISDDPVATWTAFFENDQRSAANRPWMPSAGNHENEVGNGPQGYLSYQTRFTLPDNGSRSFTSRAAPARSPSPTTARSSTRPTTLRSTPSRCASPSAATTPGTAAVEPGSGG